MNIQERLFWVGVQDPGLKVFDIEMPTNGTSYNSYLVQGKATALIDTVKAPFYEEFLLNLEAVTSLSDLQYIVVNHTEPDHTGALARLLEAAPQVKVVCTKVAQKFLKAQLNRDFDCLVAEEIGQLDLGDGVVLDFHKLPFLHWPDTMVTYWASEGVLFSCDAFGAHFCEPGKLFDDEVSDHLPAARFYYDSIVSPFNQYVRKALEALKPISLKLVCPSHGPILRSRIDAMLSCYAEWSKDVLPDDHQVVTLLYSSAYGNTERLAHSIQQGLEEQGVVVRLIKAEHGFDWNEAVEAIHGSHGLVVGSPTITADAVGSIWEVLGHLNPLKLKGRPAMAFGSFGWSGEAVKNLEARFQSLLMQPFEETLKVNFVPTECDLGKARELGQRFAEQVKEKFPGRKHELSGHR